MMSISILRGLVRRASLLMVVLVIALPGQALAAPVNDDFADAQTLEGNNGSVTTSTVGATADGFEWWVPQYTGDSSSIWFKWVAPVGGRIRFDTEGSNFNTLLAAFEGFSHERSDGLAFHDNVSAADETSEISFLAQPGQTYTIAVDGWWGLEGDVVLNWERLPPENDDLEDMEWLPFDPSWARGSWVRHNYLATSEPGEPVHPVSAGGHSVWFSYKAERTGPLHLDTLGSDLDTTLAVYSGYPVETLSHIASDDDSAGGGASELVFDAVEGNLYRIAVDGKDGATGNFRLNWIEQPEDVAANDDFAEQQKLQTGVAVAGNNDGATREWGEPPHWSSSNGASVWYRWRAPFTGGGLLHLDSQEVLSVAVYRGGSIVDLHKTTSSAINPPLDLRFPIEEDKLYRIAVDGFDTRPEAGTGPFALKAAAVKPPRIDDFAEAGGVGIEGGWRWSRTFAASSEPGEPNDFDSRFTSVWHRFRVKETGTFRFTTQWGLGRGVTSIWTGDSLDMLERLKTSVDGYKTSTRIRGKVGETYMVRVASRAVDAGYFGIRWKTL